MLFLVFRLGQDRYALDTAQVVEVVPLVNIKQLPQAPPGLAGLMDYHSEPVPVIDLSELALRQAAQRRMSTRIIIVHYTGGNGRNHMLGLMAEKATGTWRRDAADFVASGVRNDGAPYLGPICTDDNGIIQWVDAQRLLSPELRHAIYAEQAAVS
ncbi:chemotaxis protein CheW [Dyella acidisoli]|uniref:Chew domain protein n=1 Tax=Dyella acidisoli TaxID=1867834 RepID=A0ABQ5XIT7_9GAMM|nr:chemotaxis protein CheW [Dyella acidisoli]GLQ91074.1 chew domain protein [Dyella acidisoli]